MQALPQHLQAQVPTRSSMTSAWRMQGHAGSPHCVLKCTEDTWLATLSRFLQATLGQSVHGAHQLLLLLQAPVAPVAGQAPPGQPSLAQGPPPVVQQLPAPVVPHHAPSRPEGDYLFGGPPSSLHLVQMMRASVKGHS